MKVTLLGHATVLVETAPMGPIDVVVLSHGHPDHFDLPSLDRLSRHGQVVCADDPLLLHALGALGFEHITPMDPHGPMPSPHAELFPTRSENTGVRECGMVIRDDGGVRQV